MARYYIGLALSQHDPAIAIVDESGDVVFAEGAERFLQNKRAWHAIPDDVNRVVSLIPEHCEPGSELVLASSWMLTGVDWDAAPRSVSVPATDTLHFEGPSVEFDEQWRTLLHRHSTSKLHAGLNLRFRASFTPELSSFRIPELRSYDHHLCHAATACYASWFDEALCAVIDGRGETSGLSFYSYLGERIEQIHVPESTASLGDFYNHLCHLCGFDSLRGEEWKVMGLAAHGRLDSRWYEVFRSRIRVEGCELIRNSYEAPDELVAESFERQPRERADLAFTGQRVFEEVCCELLTNFHARGSSDNLVIGGGCGLNSLWNGKIVGATPFKQVFLPSAPADDGCAVGAALLARVEDHGPPAANGRGLQSPYVGTRISEITIERCDRLGGLEYLRSRSSEGPAEQAAALLAAGKIVGWVQGRAEFGPRALGNRSILADPRRADIKDVLNARVKFREEFRPFCPAILDEHGAAYFQDYQVSPYMERAQLFRPEVRSKVPGVVHVDGTGRVQSVRREWNANFHDLLVRFLRLTGIPIVLNTSFNIMGKPIIHSVEDALGMFFTTGLDALVIGELVFEKPDRRIG